MQLIDGRPVFAATDLVAYLACEHLTQLERASLAGLVERPMRDDPELDIIRKRGFQHEKRYLADLAGGGSLRGRDRARRLDRGSAATGCARRPRRRSPRWPPGADVIYQATFFDGTWRGHADFLLRVDDPERPSVWGPYHYEVADTKLARHVKASAVLQICSYIDQLERDPGRPAGVAPRRARWAAPGPWSGCASTTTWRTTGAPAIDSSRRWRTRRRPRIPRPTTYPEPVEHCDVCRWAAECVKRRRDDDHLSLVAGISGRQRQALTGRDVATLEALGDLPLPMDPRLEGDGDGRPEPRPGAGAHPAGGAAAPDDTVTSCCFRNPASAIDPERGLATLPPPSPGDLFLDLEGDPFAFDDGLDYLFGVLETDGTFHAFWSRDDDGEFSLDGERRAFEAVMDFFSERLRADPNLHIYHYAPYEPTALKRLMGRYGTREDEVDDLLRGGVLVDLLRAVRQSLRASVESYSIKRMEPFYGFTREIDLRDAGSSIVAFEQWLELGEGERPGRRPPRPDRAVQPRRRREQRCACATGWRPCAASWRARPGSRSRARAGARKRPNDCPTSWPRPRRSSSGSTDPSVIPVDPVGADPRTGGPMVARPAPRLASARGQGHLVGVLPAHGR